MLVGMNELRAKAIAGLECCLSLEHEALDELVDKNCEVCPYRNEELGTCDNRIQFFEDILSVLKMQEPRVMTYDEMMKAEICFLEVNGIEEIDPFIRFEVDGKSYWSSPYTNNKDNPFELLAEQEEYLINARCWTSRPTDEQREKVKWE